MYCVDSTGIYMQVGKSGLIATSLKRPEKATCSAWNKMARSALVLLNSDMDVSPNDIIFKYNTALLLVKPTAPLFRSRLVKQTIKSENSFAINPFEKLLTIVTKKEIDQNNTVCPFITWTDANCFEHVLPHDDVKQFILKLTSLANSSELGTLQFQPLAKTVVLNGNHADFLIAAIKAFIDNSQAL
jgi:hypothetical protein